MNNKNITILLASYNGARYIAEQLDSVINQSHVNWNLIIRDDFSCDNTVGIIQEYIKKDNRISLIKDDFGNLRCCQNFSKLMQFCKPESQYIMFCDQDDIWLPEKIERTVMAMMQLEEKYSSDSSLMVYGTYQLMSHEGLEIKSSVPDYSAQPTLRLLLSQNYIYGCTIMINKKLLDNSLVIPLTAENHDYWITLTAIVNDAYFAYLDKPLLLYRQHSDNVSGSYKDATFYNRIKRLFSDSEVISIRKRLPMFEKLLELNNTKMSTENNTLLEGYTTNIRLGTFKAFNFCFNNGINRRSKLQTIFFYFNMLRCTKF